MPPIEYHLAFLNQAVPDLKDFLLSEVLYWPLGGRSPAGKPYPRLTAGALLFSRTVVAAAEGVALGPDEIDNPIFRLEAITIEWQTAWRHKAGLELSARVRQWQNYVGEYTRSVRDNAANYSNDVQTRVFVQLLQDEIDPAAPSDRQLVAGLDARLRRLFRPGEFVWEPELKPAFAPKPYWYLYGELKI